MKKVGASNAPSPVPSYSSAPTAGGIAMKRLGSGGTHGAYLSFLYYSAKPSRLSSSLSAFDEIKGKSCPKERW